MPGLRFLRETIIAFGRASRLNRGDYRILLATRSIRLIAAAIVLCAVFQPAAVAITINMTYSNEGDSVPHDENPSWDPAGVYLKSHFAAAKAIWESLLPGSGDVSFKFEWDDDLDPPGTLGRTYLHDIDNLFVTVIEIYPNANWFVDPTPGADFEFGASTQVLYSGLTPAQQSAYFPHTPPPAGLEVGFKRAGTAVAGVNGVQADVGVDLLSVILHEMGHALGVNSDHSGPYFFKDQHVGGLNSVAVQTDNDSGHLVGDGDLPVLMCNACAVPGERVYPSATDVLAVAKVLDINNVRLQRVGRIGAGNWNDSNAWIGADVPEATQDVYLNQAGAVTLDVNVVAKSLVINGGSSVDATGWQLASSSDIKFDGGTIIAGAGSVVSADAIHGDPSTLTTAAGSTIAFNNFTRGASSATAATFNGNVRIGVGSSSSLVNFNPDTITTWNVGQILAIGNELRPTKLVIDNGTWTVGGALEIARKGEVLVDGGVYAPPAPLTGGNLNVTGPVTVNGALTYRGRPASNTTYTIAGGSSEKTTIPPLPTFLLAVPGARMTFEDTTSGIPIGASAQSGSFTVGGGTGDGGIGGVVTFKGHSHADNAQVATGAGIGGDSLRISNPVVIAGVGGRVIFEDYSYASGGNFRNYGGAAHGPQISGGATYFYNDSRVDGATFDNYGSTLQSYIGGVPAPGGRTTFFDHAQVFDGTFNNHPGQGMGSLGAGITVFNGNSNAGFPSPFFAAIYNNLGGVPGAQFGGATEFYDDATAGDATFYNQHAQGVSQNAGSAGNVRFYGSSTAGDATFYNQVGGGAVYFNDSSKAGDAHFFIEKTGTGIFGGHVIFQGNSKGGTSDITVRENAFSATVEFKGTSNAENAEITLVNGSQAYVALTNSGNLGDAKVDIGSGGSMTFRESASAGGATIRIRPGGGADFTGSNTTAAGATITLDGATVANGGTGSLNFSGGKGGDATINVNPGTVFNSAGAQISFNNSANAGTAKIIGGSATVAGAGGARISIDTSSNISNATITVGAGGYLNINGFGAATVGQLELASGAAVYLNQTELRAGALNTSNTISGPIVGVNGNSKFTKVGTGTLTLAGANTYTGLTKVDGGTLMLNGTTPGAAEVNSGATLKGTGTIAGTVTVNSGGTLAPGASPGTITIGGLAMTSGGTLEFELGSTSYDRIQSSGNLVFAGALNVSLVSGFMPTLGNTFDLFNWGTKSGTFGAVNLPILAAGLSWDATQLYTSGVISITTPPGVSGDYNNNGVVDAADYVLWRKGGQLANEVDTPGTVNGADYTAWRARFGNTSSGSGAGAAANTAVPEPSTLVLLILAAAGTCLWPYCAVHRVSKLGNSCTSQETNVF